MSAPGLDLSANALLRSIPESEIERLTPHFSTVPLIAGEHLSRVDEPLTQLYFPLEGAVSRLVQIGSGETVEVGMVGNDGVVALPILFGGSVPLGLNRVQTPGCAAAMTIRNFEEQVRAAHSPLMDVLLIYAGLQFQIVTQLTACHCLHRIEQRLSRCLLSLLDYDGGSGSLRITHDALAEFLGVHRPSVTYALQDLASDGAIALERRRVIVQDRAALNEHACECYGVIRNIAARELRRIYDLEAMRAS